METKPPFDARLKEGVAYFEEMLRVLPDDRTTLEFLAVAYPQMGETAKAESALAALGRVLLKEGDLESAAALLPRLEECAGDEARAVALKVRALTAPRPELVPEQARPTDDAFASAVASEAALAEKLGEPEIAGHLRALPDNGRLYLVSALATLEKERTEPFEGLLARLADEYGEIPVPLDAFEPDIALVSKIGPRIVRRRGVIPFARLGDLVLVVTLSPHDAQLKKVVAEALGTKVRFYLAEPRLVLAQIAKLYPEGEEKN